MCSRVLWTLWQITGDCELIGNRQKETKKIFEELGLGNSAITIITVTYIHLLKPKSDQHPNSPCSNTAESFIKIMRLLT